MEKQLPFEVLLFVVLEKPFLENMSAGGDELLSKRKMDDNPFETSISQQFVIEPKALGYVVEMLCRIALTVKCIAAIAKPADVAGLLVR